MSSAAIPDINAVLSLYKRARYVDAYRATEPLWSDPAVIDRLDTAGLLLAGRLALRLGGRNLSRWIFRQALNRAPDDPAVLYYARDARFARPDFLDDTKFFNSRPDLDSGNPELDTNWWARQAVFWSISRNFDRAHRLLDKARAVLPDNDWIDCCEGWVLFHEHRWEDSLSAVERIWAQTPGLPSLAGLLVQASGKVNRLDAAVQKLEAARSDLQSYEFTTEMSWGLLALAEQGDDRRFELAERAYDLAAGMKHLTPLADRHTGRSIELRHLDAALLLGDPERIREHAGRLNEPFCAKILRNIEAAFEQDSCFIPYTPVYQIHETCLPASVATVLSAFDIRVDHLALARELTYAGTPFWRIQEWAARKGLLVRMFYADMDVVRNLLTTGIPFVFTMNYYSSAHAEAAVRLDGSTGMILLHDPGSVRWDRVLLDEISTVEAPFGPVCMALVPPERGSDLACIPESSLVAAETWETFMWAMKERGTEAARKIVNDFVMLYPDHEMVPRIQAAFDVLTGRPARALPRLKTLLDKHPNCLQIRRELIHAAMMMDNVVLTREILEDVVERRLLPGRGPDETWRRPPTALVVQYAQLLRQSAEERDRAEHLLRRQLVHDPINAAALFELASLLEETEREGEAIHLFRMAATLDPHSEWIATSTARALRRARGNETAVRFLENRVHKLGDLVEGGRPWISLIQCLEEFGYPERAVEAMQMVVKKRPSDSAVDSFAVHFWAGAGEWDLAKAALERLDRERNPEVYFEAATNLHRSRGTLEQAIEFAEALVRESPNDMQYRAGLLTLLRMWLGLDAAIAVAEGWIEELPGSDTREVLLNDLLKFGRHADRRRTMMEERVARNPDDGWAWVELGTLIMETVDRTALHQRSPLIEELERVLGECRRVRPDAPGTRMLVASFLESQGRRREAALEAVEAVRRSQGDAILYDRMLGIAEAAGPEVMENVLDLLENEIPRNADRRYPFTSLLSAIAGWRGTDAAIAALEKWETRFPGSPGLVSARLNFQLRVSGTASNVQAALETLNVLVTRFPHDLDYRFQRAHALHILERHDEEIDALQQILTDCPGHDSARIQLALALRNRGDGEKSADLLRAGVGMDPSADELRRLWADTERVNGHEDRALKILEESVRVLPDSIGLRRALAEHLMAAGQTDEAAETCMAWTRTSPGEPAAWNLLALVLRGANGNSKDARVETALRRALEVNASFYPAADDLAEVLCETGRVEEAGQLMREQIRLCRDPAPPHSRLAWILRGSGSGAEAVDAMVEVVRDYPRHVWAWQNLLHWLEEDDRRDLTRELLTHCPCAGVWDTSLRARRLALLGKAGAPVEVLDADWDQLLADHPDDLMLQVHRFDTLREQERFDAAAELVPRVETRWPESPCGLYFRFVLSAHRKDRRAAIDEALGIWRSSVSEEWLFASVRKTLVDRSWSIPALDDALAALDQGTSFPLSGLVELVNNIPPSRPAYEGGPTIPEVEQCTRTLLPRVLEALDTEDSTSVDFAARVLSSMNEAGMSDAVMAYRDAHAETCLSHDWLWLDVGRALSLLDRHEECASWLADWETRATPPQWGAALFLDSRYHPMNESARSRESNREMARLAQIALERPARDHGADYVFLFLLEACLLGGDDDLFRESVRRFPDFLAPRKEDEKAIFREWYSLFSELLDCDAPDRVMDLCARMKQLPFLLRWLKVEWLQRVRSKVSRSRYLWIRLRLLIF